MDIKDILKNVETRLGIEELNYMQRSVVKQADLAGGDQIIYAPTGSGKTLAYVIPMLEALDDNNVALQGVIIAPSRELVIQVYQVVHLLSSGVKVTCCYGGHSMEDERNSLKETPTIIVATPGRLLDHIQKNNIDISNVRHVVIDEFDKCLELGFEDEMRHLFGKMHNIVCRVLTSATRLDNTPDYVRLRNPQIHDFLSEMVSPELRMTVYKVKSPENDKLNALLSLLFSINGRRTIVFLNHREAAERVNAFLNRNRVDSGLYHGGMEQIEREKAVAMFRNGTIEVLVTTDLASRGLDIDGVQHIIHYNLPLSVESYIHRNGRTARMNATGDIFILFGPDEVCPDFIRIDEVLELHSVVKSDSLRASMATLYFAAGRKEKISKADIVGFIIANSKLEASQIGHIDLSDHYALVAIPREDCHVILNALNAARIKGKRVRITMAGQRINV